MCEWANCVREHISRQKTHALCRVCFLSAFSFFWLKSQLVASGGGYSRPLFYVDPRFLHHTHKTFLLPFGWGVGGTNSASAKHPAAFTNGRLLQSATINISISHTVLLFCLFFIIYAFFPFFCKHKAMYTDTFFLYTHVLHFFLPVFFNYKILHANPHTIIRLFWEFLHICECIHKRIYMHTSMVHVY